MKKPAPDVPPSVRVGTARARCAAADWIHVDQAGYAAVAGIRRAGIRTPVSLDAGNPVPNLDLGLVDLYAPTESQLLGTMGREDLAAAMRAALEAGPRMVVVTRGAQGSLAAVRDGEIRFVAAAACRAPPGERQSPPRCDWWRRRLRTCSSRCSRPRR